MRLKWSILDAPVLGKPNEQTSGMPKYLSRSFCILSGCIVLKTEKHRYHVVYAWVEAWIE